MTNRHEKVRQAINPGRLRKIFLDLLSIYSPSGKEEDVQLYLEELLSRAGFAVERQEVEGERYNLHVTMGTAEPQIYLVGHVDTVPAWDLEESGPEQGGGIIRGLGSADMKGGCAAMVEAWLALAEALPPSDRPPCGPASSGRGGGKQRRQHGLPRNLPPATLGHHWRTDRPSGLLRPLWLPGGGFRHHRNPLPLFPPRIGA